MTIIGIIAFIVGWIYAVCAFGFFLGLGLGWFPAIVIAWIIDTVIVAALALVGLSLAQHKWKKKSARTYEDGSVAPQPGTKEYLDWANREGRWRNDVEELPMPQRGTREYLDWANREGRWAER